MFLVNSRHPLFCAPRPWLPRNRALFSRSYEGILPSSFNTVLSIASVCSTSPPVSVSGTVYGAGAVSRKEVASPHNPVSTDTRIPSSRSAGWGIFTPFPSATALALALGARLTLRGLTLRRNPWTFGVRVSHPHYDATHVSIRTSDTSSRPHDPPSQAYGTLRYRARAKTCTRSFGAWL